MYEHYVRTLIRHHGREVSSIPWASLTYDEGDNAYVVGYTKEQLQSAPAGSIDELTQNDGLSVRDRTYTYYKAAPYWQS